VEKQHTPGPWFYDESIATKILINAKHAAVAVVPYLDDEAKANARLLAAAPELFDALQALVSAVSEPALVAQAHAALRKAQGKLE